MGTGMSFSKTVVFNLVYFRGLGPCQILSCHADLPILQFSFCCFGPKTSVFYLLWTFIVHGKSPDSARLDFQ